MPLFSFLIASVRPILGRLLASLGMGIVTFAGYSALVTQIISYINAQLGTLSVKTLQIVTMFGLTESLGIVLGAFVTAASLSSFKKLKIL
jgi:cell division protein FtsX